MAAIRTFEKTKTPSKTRQEISFKFSEER